MISIRPLEQADHPEWLRLWRGYQEFYRVQIPDATSAVVFERLLDPEEPMNGALALREGRQVGLVHHIRHRSCWTVEDYCYLQDLFVDREVRGAGIGRALIEHVYQVAAAQGCSRVYWHTHESNAEAMVLYNRIAERSGFIQYRKTLTPAAKT
ncbi:MAG TPA: GNAT family N-acetyltransferase [Steroidobacteraceae bacterium]|nr:GNAT family N-acetyltransferase [Steroidobacteraceae bacterium]